MVFYFLAAFVFFCYRMIVSNNKFLTAACASAYFMGAEVFLRMARSAIIWEQGKYAVIFFCLWGMLYVGFKRNAVPYIIYFLLLLPAIGVSLIELDFDSDFRKSVLFNLSGPFCLTVASVFLYGRTIKLKNFLKILDYIIYPLITTAVYVVLFMPSGKDIFIHASSNAAASGNYSGNQVATVFGLGFFILLTRFFIPYRNPIVHWTMMFFMALMMYRALLTFSRGGVVASVLMAVVFIAIYWLRVGVIGKAKATLKMVALGFGVVFLWGYTTVATGGMITNRYTNKDALGREKEDITTGRAELAEAELAAFSTNPLLGKGTGGSKEFFEDELGISGASHNEVTRMFSEHGLFGILALMILMFAPWISILQGRRNIFFVAFQLFWFLTLLHAAMRIAAPAFIYALCLLNLDYAPEKKTAVRRKSIAEPGAVAHHGRYTPAGPEEGRL